MLFDSRTNISPDVVTRLPQGATVVCRLDVPQSRALLRIPQLLCRLLLLLIRCLPQRRLFPVLGVCVSDSGSCCCCYYYYYYYYYNYYY